MSDANLRNSLRAGHKLHWYQIEKVLGQGGFGITYLAYDTNLDQHVAIKEYLPMELAVREGDFSVYPASQAQDSRYQWGLERFLTEARTLARFKHPAVVRVLSVFEANNTAYMVMEYQRGSSLQQLLDERRTLPENELVNIVIPLLDGLEVIHSHGFIHRDIKPSNIFIHDDGLPVLLDFGSARQALGEETRTLTSVVSPGYAPFEQYYSKSDRQGPWTDIYGLGATLYRCLTGLQPMAAIDRSEAILRAERDVFVSASEIGRGQYSDSFLQAVDCALLFNETKRPQTIGEWRPYFDFSVSTEQAARDALHTRFPDEAPTRFSALVDQPATTERTAIINPDARAGASRRTESGRARPRAVTDESAVARSDSRDVGGSRPVSRPVSGAPPSARLAGGDSRRRSEPPPSAPYSTTQVPPPPVRRWPLYLAFVLILLAGGTGYAVYSGLTPSSLLSGNEVARLVAQGDRALAAGQVLSPAASSAFAFYRRAYALDPGDVDARHGLRLAGEQFLAAVDAAVSARDAEQIEALMAVAREFPDGIVDLGAARTALTGGRIQAVAAQKGQERVAEFLALAEADIAAGKFVGAGTDNALAHYRAALILDPENVDAKAGLSRLAVVIAERGQAALTTGDLTQALTLHGQASLIDPAAPPVAALGAAVGQARRQAASAEEKAAAISELKLAAAADIDANRLTTPPGNNALERYRELEVLDPGNPDAAAGLRRVHDRYIAMATQALARDEFAAAGDLARKAQDVDSTSEPARTLQREISQARQRAAEIESARQAEAELAQVAEAAAARQAAERARAAAEAARRQQEEEEAARLLAAAEAKAVAEKEARLAAEQAALDAVNAEPRMVVDFLGFDPKYARDGMTRDGIFREVAPLIRAAGYEIVTRGQVHDAQYQWTNVKLLAYRLNVNENTATGQYSYVGSVNLLEDATLRLSLAEALDERPTWSRSRNGLGPPTDLSKLAAAYVDMTRAFLQKRPGRRR